MIMYTVRNYYLITCITFTSAGLFCADGSDYIRTNSPFLEPNPIPFNAQDRNIARIHNENDQTDYVQDGLFSLATTLSLIVFSYFLMELIVRDKKINMTEHKETTKPAQPPSYVISSSDDAHIYTWVVL